MINNADKLVAFSLVKFSGEAFQQVVENLCQKQCNEKPEEFNGLCGPAKFLLAGILIEVIKEHAKWN
jgi:hypothetical protein